MRSPRIQDVYINNLSNSSIFVCGSIGCVKSRFAGTKETNMSNPQLINDDSRGFASSVPVWLSGEEDVDEFEILTDPSDSMINMKYIKVLSISSGTTFQIGTSDSIDLESRISEIKRVNGSSESDNRLL